MPSLTSFEGGHTAEVMNTAHRMLAGVALFLTISTSVMGITCYQATLNLNEVFQTDPAGERILTPEQVKAFLQAVQTDLNAAQHSSDLVAEDAMSAVQEGTITLEDWKEDRQRAVQAVQLKHDELQSVVESHAGILARRYTDPGQIRLILSRLANEPKATLVNSAEVLVAAFTFLPFGIYRVGEGVWLWMTTHVDTPRFCNSAINVMNSEMRERVWSFAAGCYGENCFEVWFGPQPPKVRGRFARVIDQLRRVTPKETIEPQIILIARPKGPAPTGGGPAGATSLGNSGS